MHDETATAAVDPTRPAARRPGDSAADGDGRVHDERDGDAAETSSRSTARSADRPRFEDRRLATNATTDALERRQPRLERRTGALERRPAALARPPEVVR